jgi:hypothetical protein
MSGMNSTNKNHRAFMLARMAALIAVDAPPAPYLANAEPPRTAGSPPATSKG